VNWLLAFLFPRLTEKQRDRIETAFYVVTIILVEVGWLVYLFYFHD
jgi:hypothetical protein